MFKELKEINSRPGVFEFYTAEALWADPHTAQQMLTYHLNDAIDVSSRNRDFIDKSAAWIVSRFEVDAKTAIADFGCGPGLYTTRLAQQGAVVTGIDFSEHSLGHARRVADTQGLEIHYVHTNYLAFETNDRFDLIIMIMCDFCALSPEQRRQLLAKFHLLLKPGGRVLLDVYSLNTFDRKEESAAYELNQLNGFWSAEDYYCFVNCFKYEAQKVLLDKYTIIEASRKRVVYNWLQCYSKDALENEFVENGFTVEGVYADVAGQAYAPDAAEIALVAKKA